LWSAYQCVCMGVGVIGQLLFPTGISENDRPWMATLWSESVTISAVSRSDEFTQVHGATNPIYGLLVVRSTLLGITYSCFRWLNSKRCHCRLDAIAFKPSKSQKKLVNRYVSIFSVVRHGSIHIRRWNRYVIGSTEVDAMVLGQGKEMYVL
jgi:hypothetical protein